MTIKIIKPLIALCNEIPADFMAANSLFSEKLPKVIIEVTRIVRGKIKGTRLGIM